MKFKAYSIPEGTGWLGWIENCEGAIMAFIKLDGTLVFDW